VNAHLILAVLALIALRVGFLYLAPFGRCPRCKGTGHIKRGPRRRPVCPRCKGRRRIQRRGSRTVHRLVFKIRHGRQVAARYQQQEDRHGNP
jgi:DnaJ-class molecular chaperone